MKKTEFQEEKTFTGSIQDYFSKTEDISYAELLFNLNRDGADLNDNQLNGFLQVLKGHNVVIESNGKYRLNKKYKPNLNIN